MNNLMPSFSLSCVSIFACHLKEALPIDLLLLADPSVTLVNNYLPNSMCFVAKYNEEIVGVYVLQPDSKQNVELVNIAVEPKYQGYGVGGKLLDHAIGFAKDHKYLYLNVSTGNSSLGPLGFYQKKGFRMIGIEPDFFIKHYPEPIYENGVLCRDKIILRLTLLDV